MRRAAIWMALTLAWACPAAADELATMTVEPWNAFDGVERPHRYIVTLRAVQTAEVVADRRLIELELRPTEGRRRRRVRCRHRRMRRHTGHARTVTLQAGDTWQEWIDLRTYCWGRRLDFLEDGAEVEVRYGWRRASRRRWVARTPDSPRREWTSRLEVAPFTFAAVEHDEETRRVEPRPEPDDAAEAIDADAPAAEDAPGPAPIRLSLASTTASGESGVRFSVAVRARDGTERVYVRPDSFVFRVSGPTGTFRCAMPPWGGAPVADLYERITTRHPARERLVASELCPEGTFARAGIYEVTPKVRLPYSGQEWELEAVTGRYVGPTVPIRVLTSEDGYVEQIPERPEPEAEPDGA